MLIYNLLRLPSLFQCCLIFYTYTCSYLVYLAYLRIVFTILTVSYIWIIMILLWKKLGKIKKHAGLDLNHRMFCINACFSLQLSVYRTCVEELSPLLTFKINWILQRHSFHFKLVLLQLMKSLLTYQHAKNTDGQTESFLVLCSTL